VVFIAGRSPQTASKASSVANRSADASGTTTKPGPEAAAASGAFGDVTHQSALRAAVRQRVRHATQSEFADNSADKPGSTKTGTGPLSSTGSRADAGAAIAVAPSRPACVTALRRTEQLPPPVLSGSGTSGGRPVYVIVFEVGSRHVVYVVSAADCSVLARVPIG
jgi:hypothetical protein